MSVDQFVELHGALIVKHARAHTARTPDALPAEDLVAELVRVLEGVERAGLDLFSISSPDGYLRGCMPLVGMRARRRRTLVQQVTSGDDLAALTADLEALDAELPRSPAPITKASTDARKRLDAIHAGLAPRDALVFALCFEDDRQLEGAALALTTATDDLLVSRARALTLARELRTFGDDHRHASDEELSALLVALARAANDPAAGAKHIDEPLLALLRSGDASDDLADAFSHVARCVDCRARVAEGETSQRSVVVMAIDAGALGAKDDLVQRAAEQSHARLVPRGPGRYTAVLEAENLVAFKAKLTAGDVARVAIAGQVEMPVARRRAPSLVDPTEAGGTDGAELKAWSEMAKVGVAPAAAPQRARLWLALGGAVLLAVALVAIALGR